MSPARDSQRSKVYRWEQVCIPGYQEAEWQAVPVRRYRTDDGVETEYRQRCRIDGEMTLVECAALVERVWAAYRPNVTRLPKVTPGHNALLATGSRAKIDLPRWARQPVVILHEVAHSLQPTLRWAEHGRTGQPPLAGRRDSGAVVSVAWHGPEFVRLFIELLVRYHTPARGKRGMLLRTVRAARIKVGRLQDCPKPHK
jgi:hypothetical protein